jgi:hypothetical protein
MSRKDLGEMIGRAIGDASVIAAKVFLLIVVYHFAMKYW